MIVPGERPIAVLRMDKLRSLYVFILKMQNIHSSMLNQPDLYPDITPPLAVFKANIDTLIEATSIAETWTKGKVQERNKAYHRVLNNVLNLKNYIQSLANEQEDLNVAKELIIKSGFELKNSRNYIKPPFYGKLGKVSGSIYLYAKAAARVRAAYNWQISEDNKNWSDLETTLIASIKITGLKPGKTYYFRYKSITKQGSSDWSEVIEYIIL